MANSFDAAYYLHAKLDQLHSAGALDAEGRAYTPQSLQAALDAAGLTPEAHYLAYGRTEGLNPNAYFNETEFLNAKLTQLQGLVATDDNGQPWTLDAVKAAIAATGLTPLEYYETAGWKEGTAQGLLLNPSNAFDATAYMAAKLYQLQQLDAGNPVWASMTPADLVPVFEQAGLSPVTHYMLYGAGEAAASGLGLLQTVPTAQRVAADPLRELAETVPDNDGPATPNMFEPANPVDNPHDVGHRVPSTSQFWLPNSDLAFLSGISGVSADNFTYNADLDASTFSHPLLFDAEKSPTVPKDDGICWAATTANMLAATGWGQDGLGLYGSAAVTTDVEDRVLDYMRASFLYGDTRGGKTLAGLDWFASGHYELAGYAEADQPAPGTGGLLPGVDLLAYSRQTDFSFQVLTAAFNEGAAVGLDIVLGDSLDSLRAGESTGGHGVTCWGFVVDPDRNPADRGYYTGLIISDSDDQNMFADPRQAPDTLRIVDVQFDSALDSYYAEMTYGIGNTTVAVFDEMNVLAQSANLFGAPFQSSLLAGLPYGFLPESA